jgi:hypothetical protein
MFNPKPRIDVLPIIEGKHCYVIDDALLEPDALVAKALRQRAHFAMAPGNAYPGVELEMDQAFTRQLDDFFRLHVRSQLGARRTLHASSRLAMVTLSPAALHPAQWLCHRDSLTNVPGQCIAASVLYLFRDADMGGTSFYVPKRTEEDTVRMVRDSGILPARLFARDYGVAAGYMTGSNDWFERVLTVPAKWNRLIFYDGNLYHSADIRAPERLGDDPAQGRLSLNGFFVCSRQAG